MREISEIQLPLQALPHTHEANTTQEVILPESKMVAAVPGLGVPCQWHSWMRHMIATIEHPGLSRQPMLTRCESKMSLNSVLWVWHQGYLPTCSKESCWWMHREAVDIA